VKAGVSINPATPVCMIEEVLSDVDMVLVMSVNPGFGGQKFIPSALDKIRALDNIRKERNLDFVIEIDGGAGADNIDEILAAGTDIVVAGSSVFKKGDIDKQVKLLTQNM
ncbi:MAG: ribulose-phosphate 3-epimerase, partial [Clostridia bacterium]|nr:ribulose-phosphate 3-epimerase [Clostridia bacterium]